MNKLEKRMSEMKSAGKKALIAYLTAGDPSLSVSAKLLNALAENGADVIELGVPFSDPLADGPVLQASAARALAAGTTLDDVFLLANGFCKKFSTPVVLLAYYNSIYRKGVEQFCREAAEAGVSAIVVPDLPYEEAGQLDLAAASTGLINIRFLAPTTTENRMITICKSSAGFIYCVTVTGVTGGCSLLDPGMLTLLANARKYTEVPLALGFGISTPKQAAAAAAAADAVIVGTALVRQIENINDPTEKSLAAGRFINSLKRAIEGAL
ncbi:MAG: Tryptophan synthase alpha chain [Syntrophomonadaceae bacterium]|nr:Tryptophan synthase alpha chain [Bacillota bacterium]